jgi:phage-related tail protein
LRALNLAALAGRPIEEVFVGLADYVCPEDGSVDAGIARDAFIETIADLAQNGITDLNTLTPEQLRIVFELYATHAIEARLCNDIGASVVTVPTDAGEAATLEEQLGEFIRGAVSDALDAAGADITALTPDRVLGFVTGVYEQAFEILEALADEEDDEL